MSRQDCEQLQFCQADFLASHSVQPGSGEARRMTVTYGRRCLELYRKSGPLGSLVRMLLESSHWRSTRCYLTWKASATPARRLLFRLAPSMPRTDETVVPFWPTPTTPRPHDSENTAGKYLPSQKQKDLAYAVAMWPTPRANDAKKRGNISPDPRNGLPGAVRMWPTPKSSDSKGTGPVGSASQTHDAKKDNLRGVVLNDQIGGQLNPTWVEWLMGFPLGWTDLNVSETP